MHRLTNLSALHNQRCLYAFAYIDQIVMYSTYSQQ